MQEKRQEEGKVKKERELTIKQKLFIEYYEGNATEAARKAGYTGSDETLRKTAFDLMQHPNVSQQIRQKNDTSIKTAILNREQRMELLTILAQSAEKDSDKLKAVDILNKMNAEYIQKVEHSGSMPVQIVHEEHK